MWASFSASLPCAMVQWKKLLMVRTAARGTNIRYERNALVWSRNCSLMFSLGDTAPAHKQHEHREWVMDETQRDYRL